MIDTILFLSAIFIFSMSSVVLLIGRPILRIIPAINKLDKEEVLITKIEISPNIINSDGEILLDFTSKTFLKKHVKHSIDKKRLENYTSRFKLGQMMRLAFYYSDKKLDKIFKTFKALCNILFILGLVILGTVLGTHKLNTDTIKDLIDSFNNDLLRYYTFSQLITFYTIFINIVTEIRKIDGFFNHREL